jgi:hypothetical protein
MWYISFGGGAHGVNNIRVYYDSGRPHAKPDLLPTGPGDPPLQELRGFAIASGLLYVVNTHESLSQILVYAMDAHGEYGFQAFRVGGRGALAGAPRNSVHCTIGWHGV